MSYTKNELAVIDLISDINKLFSYVGEENDQIDFEDLRQFAKCPLGVALRNPNAIINM